MRLWLSFTMALHLFIGAALVSWAPFSSAGPASATAAVAGFADPAVSEFARSTPGLAVPADDDSLGNAISLALADLPVELSEVLSSSPRRQPEQRAQPTPIAPVKFKWTSATPDGLLRPPKTLTSV